MAIHITAKHKISLSLCSFVFSVQYWDTFFFFFNNIYIGTLDIIQLVPERHPFIIYNCLSLQYCALSEPHFHIQHHPLIHLCPKSTFEDQLHNLIYILRFSEKGCLKVWW